MEELDRPATQDEMTWRTILILLLGQGHNINEALLQADIALDAFRKLHVPHEAPE
jgi:hypothetical protein